MLTRLIHQKIVFSIIFLIMSGNAAAQSNTDQKFEQRIADEITARIENFLSSGKIEELRGEVFIIPADQARFIHTIAVTPAAAFEVTGPLQNPDGTFLIRIIDPSALYVVQAGIKDPVAVEVSIVRKTTSRGRFQLDAKSACMNTLIYRQIGGGIVNIAELLAHPLYETTLDYPADILRQHEVSTQVTFERIQPGKATVTLRLRSRETGDVQEVTNVIPECGISSTEPVSLPAPAPIDPVQPAPSPLPPAITESSQTWVGVEGSLGVTGRLAFDVTHDVDGPLLAWGLFGEYSFIDLGPRHSPSEPIFGLRAGAGWRWGDTSLLAQFPLGLTNRSREMRLGAEVVFARAVRENIDIKITTGAMIVEEGKAEILLIGGVTLYFAKFGETADEP